MVHAKPLQPVFDDFIFVKHQHQFIKVAIQDILFLASEHNYTTLQTAQRKFLIRGNLKQSHALFPQGYFLRVHKSYVVNLKHIDSFSACAIHIKEHEIPVSRNKREVIFEQFRIAR